MAKRVLSLFAVEDAKIRKVLTDPIGGPATYGPALDVPGIKKAVVTGDVNVVQLRGDNRALESQTTITGLTLTYDHAKLSLDVLEVMLGASTVETGVAPSSVATWTMPASPVFGEFVMEWRTPRYSDGSDVHMRSSKLKLAGIPELGMVEEDYRTVEGVECSMVPLESGSGWFSIISNETAAEIAETFVAPPVPA